MTCYTKTHQVVEDAFNDFAKNKEIDVATRNGYRAGVYLGLRRTLF